MWEGEETWQDHYLDLARDVLSTDWFAAHATERDRAVVEALAPVRALHTPDPSGDWCDHCWTGPDSHGNGPSPEWPCATIRAVRAALPDEPEGTA